MDKINTTPDNLAITIYATNGKLQTTYNTIKMNSELVKLLDTETNTIHTDISIYNLKKIINYLRGYYSINKLRTIPSDALKLGIPIEINGYVYLNIGGKLHYLPKNILILQFEYFELFFKYNEHLHPDYSSILIDRCCDIFDTIYKNTINGKKLSLLNDTEKQELKYYGLKKISYFINNNIFKYCQFHFGTHKIINCASSNECGYDIFRLESDQDKYILFYFKNYSEKKLLLDEILIEYDGPMQNTKPLSFDLIRIKKSNYFYLKRPTKIITNILIKIPSDLIPTVKLLDNIRFQSTIQCKHTIDFNYNFNRQNISALADSDDQCNMFSTKISLNYFIMAQNKKYHLKIDVEKVLNLTEFKTKNLDLAYVEFSVGGNIFYKSSFVKTKKNSYTLNIFEKNVSSIRYFLSCNIQCEMQIFFIGTNDKNQQIKINYELKY